MKITKQRLKDIIREELEGDTFAMSLDQLTDQAHLALSQLDKGLSDFQSALARLVEQHDAGEFVNLRTHANMLQMKLDDLRERYVSTLARLENR
jgi:hypothetical protein